MKYYHMIYPGDRWVPGADLVMAARDTIENERLIPQEVNTAEEAIKILESIGQVTITNEGGRTYIKGSNT